MYITSTFLVVMLNQDAIGAQLSYETQLFNFGFALASLVFIFLGYIGIRDKNEVYLRLYLYCMLVTFIMDTTVLIIKVQERDCKSMPDFLELHGGAFACGAMRVWTFLVSSLVTMTTLYSIFIVWSLCEDYQIGDNNIESLMVKDAKQIMRDSKSITTGLFGTGAPSAMPLPVGYGSLATAGFAGSNAIFGGRHHEVTYPPKHAL